MTQQGEGNIFDALDAAVEESAQQQQEQQQPETVQMSRDPHVYRKPVTLHKDETTGEQYFYLQKGTFPNRSITNLNIVYTADEKAQMTDQVTADKTCPEIILKDVKVECFLGQVSDKDDPSEFLNDESFRLSGSKIVGIRMRIYSQQKQDAQKQLVNSDCNKVVLKLDLECRLAPRESQQ